MDKKLNLFAPIAKTEKTKDGGLEVWGMSTLEVKDKDGEIADYNKTVQAFEKWSNEVSKRTDGKNLGNVRLMHQPIVAGKTIHWEPTETTVNIDGVDQIVKGIYVGAYIPPTKPEIIKDVEEGILSAFSIGGSYGERWWDETAKAFRYAPIIAEYSLVDNPACPGADITAVISKADGPWNKSDRNLGKGVESVDGDLEKRAKPAGSYEEFLQRLDAALTEKFRGFNSWWDGYRCATYPDLGEVVIYNYDTCKYYKVSFTDTDGVITIGDNPQEVTEVTTYVPVEVQKFIEGELKKRKQKEKSEEEKLKDAAKARAEKYGISFKEGKGHLTPPKDYPTDEADYGDPVNYAYPIDSSRVQAAVSYFNHKGQMEAGGYKSEEWAKIGKRIAERAGEGHSYKDDKIETPSTEKGAEKVLTLEEIQKAAQAAGLTVEQVQEFFKALTPIDQPPAPVTVTTVDGDGDTDNNKEFPNPPEGSQKINIPAGQSSVEEAERETAAKAILDDMIKSIGGLSEGLAKAGKAISQKNMIHLTHAQNHIKAAMDGTEYGPEHHLEVEGVSQNKNTDTGAEAPEVTEKVIASALQKNAGVLFSDELTKFEALVKGLASTETLTKALEPLLKMGERLETVEQMVKEIHETPQPGGPVLNGGSPDIRKFLNPQGDGQPDYVSAQTFIKSINDPILRDKASQELAIQQAKGIFKGGNN